MKHRPEGKTQAEWEQMWQAGKGLLDPLAATIVEMMKGLDVVSAEDLESPNHYGKLLAQQVKKQTLQKILDLLPK